MGKGDFPHSFSSLYGLLPHHVRTHAAILLAIGLRSAVRCGKIASLDLSQRSPMTKSTGETARSTPRLSRFLDRVLKRNNAGRRSEERRVGKEGRSGWSAYREREVT